MTVEKLVSSERIQKALNRTANTIVSATVAYLKANKMTLDEAQAIGMFLFYDGDSVNIEREIRKAMA